jgi:hypothetical protein
MLKNCKRPSLLRPYATYYKQARTHLSTNKDALPEGLTFDFAAKDIDEPLTTDELRSMRASSVSATASSRPLVRAIPALTTLLLSATGSGLRTRWLAGPRKSRTG